MPIFSSVLLLTLSVALVSFNLPKKAYVPPGTVRINDTLYFDSGEITNLDWREYEYWTLRDCGRSSAEYQKTLPDTLVWQDEQLYGNPVIEYYYRHPAYSNYPVVGVTYDQVVEYCKWRTDRVMQ